jgi:hydrogenase maturation protease
MTAGGTAGPSPRPPEGTRTLVLGLGNPILGDDGVGILVAREARRRLAGLGGVETREVSFAGLDLVELLAGFDRAVLVDAIKTPCGEPGAIYRLDPEELPTTDRLMATHEIDLITALALGRRMGLSMPRDVVIYAVEVEDDRSFGEALTPIVARAVGPTAARIAAEALAEPPEGGLGRRGGQPPSGR